MQASTQVQGILIKVYILASYKTGLSGRRHGYQCFSIICLSSRYSFPTDLRQPAQARHRVSPPLSFLFNNRLEGLTTPRPSNPPTPKANTTSSTPIECQ